MPLLRSSLSLPIVLCTLEMRTNAVSSKLRTTGIVNFRVRNGLLRLVALSLRLYSLGCASAITVHSVNWVCTSSIWHELIGLSAVGIGLLALGLVVVVPFLCAFRVRDACLWSSSIGKLLAGS